MKWRGKKERDDFSLPYDDELGFDPSDPELYSDGEDEIEALRGTIDSGVCLICGEPDGMKFTDGVCFVCSKCGQSVSDETYYRWAAGYETEFDDSYDDIY